MGDSEDLPKGNELSAYQIGDIIAGKYKVMDVDCSPRYIVLKDGRSLIMSELQLQQLDEDNTIIFEEKEIMNYTFISNFNETGLS